MSAVFCFLTLFYPLALAVLLSAFAHFRTKAHFSSSKVANFFVKNHKRYLSFSYLCKNSDRIGCFAQKWWLGTTKKYKKRYNLWDFFL